MYSIKKAEKLAANIYLMVVEAPRVAKHCLPGQFVIVKMDDRTITVAFPHPIGIRMLIKGHRKLRKV